jgi:hypothetical protein
MYDPFAVYNQAMGTFLQGGKTDLATLYSETDKLRKSSFVAPDTTPLMSFYRDVMDRYQEKMNKAKEVEESLREDINKKYTKEENQYLNTLKRQFAEDQLTGGKLIDTRSRLEQQRKLAEVSNIQTIEEFRKLYPTYAVRGIGRLGSEYSLLSNLGIRKTADEIYKDTNRKTWGEYAASLTDLSVFGSQVESASASLKAEKLKLSKENERKQREFIETKQKLLESAEAIGRAKRPAYTERPL